MAGTTSSRCTETRPNRAASWTRPLRVLAQTCLFLATTGCYDSSSVVGLGSADAKRRTADGHYPSMRSVNMIWAHAGPIREILAPYLDMLTRQGATIDASRLTVFVEVDENSVLTLGLTEDARGATATTILCRFIVARRFRDAVARINNPDIVTVAPHAIRREKDRFGRDMLESSDGLMPWSSTPGFQRFFETSSVSGARLERSMLRCETVFPRTDRLRVALLLPKASGEMETSAEIEFRDMDVEFAPEFGVGK